MKQLIILTAITGAKVAIRPSSIRYIEEIKGERPKIQVKTEGETWNISAKDHTIDDIVKEIEDISINEQQIKK